MTTAQLIVQLSHQLETSLGQAAFPAAHKRLGTQLLEKLQQPLQITIVGLPQSGKTSLINLLLGRAAVPATSGVNIVEIVYGPQPRTVVDYSDGTRDESPGILDAFECEKTATKLTFELPDEHLRVQSYAKVTVTGTESQIKSSLQFVSEKSALVIWSSENFLAQEQALWSCVPDHIKDHSFLALTKADRHQMKGELAHRIAELEAVVSEEFFGLYPIAIPQAMKARDFGDTPHPELWTSSGGEALTEAIDQQISLGRAEVLDRARALLDAVKIEAPTETTKPNSSAKKAASKPLENAACETGAPRQSTIQNRKCALEAAIQSLQVNAESLLREVDQAVTPNFSGIIDHCMTTIRDMSDVLQDAAREDAFVEKLLLDAQQGENMLLLLQLEDDENAAADAVSLMVQLKKEAFAGMCA